MAVEIKDVTISPNKVTTGQTFTVTILAIDACWEDLKKDFATWGEVRRRFTNWNKVKNYIYNTSDPTPSANALYTSDGYALFDVDAVEICVE